MKLNYFQLILICLLHIVHNEIDVHFFLLHFIYSVFSIVITKPPLMFIISELQACSVFTARCNEFILSYWPIMWSPFYLACSIHYNNNFAIVGVSIFAEKYLDSGIIYVWAGNKQIPYHLLGRIFFGLWLEMSQSVPLLKMIFCFSPFFINFSASRVFAEISNLLLCYQPRLFDVLLDVSELYVIACFSQYS